MNISAFEYNPDNHSSTLLAQVLTLNDSLIDEIQFSKVDSTFTGILYFNSTEEGFYKILFQQNGIDIPSKTFYSKLRFTSAGPVIVDSLYSAFQPAQSRFAFRPYLRNLGTTLQITKPSIRVICNDSIVTNISQYNLLAPTILPGQRVACQGATSIYYDPNLVNDTITFNIKFEISSDGFKYWNMDTTICFILTGIEDESLLPTNYSLEQNFPNPFNPSTKIKYSIPKSSQVTLKIFNTLGEEMETLVNEEKPVGTYEVNWNAANLPSGVYFYSLQAGDFVQTRKMILLK